MPETLYTVEEAAQRLKMHPDTLRRQLRQGRIRSVRTGKLWRIPESVLTAPESGAPSIEGELSPDELAALFAPPTPEEIAQRLAALDSIKSAAAARDSSTHPLDLSGDRGEVYGYTERENAQI